MVKPLHARSAQTFPHTPARKQPLTMSILPCITARADFSDPWEAQYITMALVAHDGLLRAGELLHLRLSDVTWHRAHVTLPVRESKANKVSGLPEYVRIYASDWRLCGFTALRAYWLRMRMDSGHRRDYLFSSSSPSAPMPKEIWVRYIASHIEALGFNPASYSGHSFRSGGATDLWQGNCRPRVIQLYGRWLSDAFWLYVRDNPHAGAREVAQAFSSLARHSRKNTR